MRDFLSSHDPLAHLPEDYEPCVDLFAGGGGASLGMEKALDMSQDIAAFSMPKVELEVRV